MNTQLQMMLVEGSLSYDLCEGLLTSDSVIAWKETTTRKSLENQLLSRHALNATTFLFKNSINSTSGLTPFTCLRYCNRRGQTRKKLLNFKFKSLEGLLKELKSIIPKFGIVFSTRLFHHLLSCSA